MASSGSPPLKLLAAQWSVSHRPCRAITRVPVPGEPHLSWDRSLTWIAPELEESASKVLTMEMTARKRQSLREERTGAPPAGGQKK